MPDPITYGHLVMLVGLVLLASAGAFGFTAWRWRGAEHGRGTPGYARARLARRKGLYTLILGLALLAAGCFTPLAEMAVA